MEKCAPGFSGPELLAILISLSNGSQHSPLPSFLQSGLYFLRHVILEAKDLLPISPLMLCGATHTLLSIQGFSEKMGAFI